jgi:Ras-related protein Rab-5C
VISAKIMILGAVGVGKTSLVKRFVQDRFDADYKTTIGVDIQTCNITLAGGGEAVRLMLWDTDGDFGQRIFETAYVKGASGAIIVGDASRPTTVEKMIGLREAFEQHLPGRPARVVVNKCDLIEGKPNLVAAGTRASEILLTSAKSGEGVGELFLAIASDIARRKPAN